MGDEKREIPFTAEDRHALNTCLQGLTGQQSVYQRLTALENPEPVPDTREQDLNILFHDQKQANLRLTRIERLLGLDKTPALEPLENLREVIVTALRDMVVITQAPELELLAPLQARVRREGAGVFEYVNAEARLILEKMGEKWEK